MIKLKKSKATDCRTVGEVQDAMYLDFYRHVREVSERVKEQRRNREDFDWYEDDDFVSDADFYAPEPAETNYFDPVDFPAASHMEMTEEWVEKHNSELRIRRERGEEEAQQKNQAAE